MKKGLILSLMFLLTLVLGMSSVLATPLFSGQAFSQPDWTEYLYQKNYGFQIAIYNNSDVLGNNNISFVWFRLGRTDGTWTNYTNATTPAWTNGTVASAVFYINFTQEQLGRANSTTDWYNITWFANETETGTQNVSTVTAYRVNKSTKTFQYMNVSRRSYPTGTGTELNYFASGVNLTYSAPVSQNITGWYGSDRFATNVITFTLYQSDSSIGTSNPQSKIFDYTDTTDTWVYNTSGNNNYTAASKNFTITYSGGAGGGGGGTGPPPTNIVCPYECCVDDGQHINKLCPDGSCINHNCIVGVTTTPIVTTIPSGFELPIIGNVQIGMNTKFIALMFGVFMFMVIFIGLIVIVMK